MSGKKENHNLEPGPGGEVPAVPSSNIDVVFPRNDDANPINSNHANDWNAMTNPSLFVPNIRTEDNNNNNNNNGGGPNRSSDLQYLLGATRVPPSRPTIPLAQNHTRSPVRPARQFIPHTQQPVHPTIHPSNMDSRVAQAWISSAPKTAARGPVIQLQAPVNNNHDSSNDNVGEKQSVKREEFLDEFADSVDDTSNRKTKHHNNRHVVRNPFEGLRRSLFSPTGLPLKQQQDGDHVVRRDEDIEVRLSWRSEDDQNKVGLCDTSMPSTPPSIPDDLIDLSVNKDDSGEINNDDYKVPPMMTRQHSYGPNPVPVDNDADVREEDDEDENDDPNNSGDNTLKAVASPRIIAQDTSPFLWMRNAQAYIPDEIVLDDDQRTNMEDEQLTGDGEMPHEVQNNNVNNHNSNSSGVLFRPPTLQGTPSRPMPIRGDDRQITPQSWHTPIGSISMSLMRPKGIIGSKRAISGGSRRTRGSVPQSPVSRRSAKSEKYYHSYETNLATPPRPVPPFVVVHSAGSAVVKVTPKKTTIVQPSSSGKARRRSQSEPNVSNGFEPFLPDLNEKQQNNEADCGCDGEGAKTKTKTWCRNWGRPVTIALTSAVFVLALVTVVTSLVASRNQKRDQERQQLQPEITLRPRPPLLPTEAPVLFSPTDIGTNNELILDAATDDLSVLWEGVVQRPYEETQNPAIARPTLPPRTFAPTASPYRGEDITILTSAPTMLPDNFPDFVPTNLPFLVPRTQEPTTRAELLDTNPEPQQIPWNNYVIGLLSVESPTTFSYLDDSTSPQFLALQWISVDSSRKGGSSAYTMDASLQRFALATVYFSLEGSTTWFDDEAWLSTVVHVCDWKGITCDDSYTAVLSLDLANNGLSGSLPDELKLLKYLQTLHFPGNSIGGTLPTDYSILYHLQELDLSGNLLTGSIPKAYGGFGSFEVLKILDLSNNQLEGSIPYELGDMSSLETVSLCSNAITGTIPSALGSLENLKSLKLGNNELIGDLPSSICDATSFTFEAVVDCVVGCECCTRCCGGNSGYDNDSNTCC